MRRLGSGRARSADPSPAATGDSPPGAHDVAGDSRAPTLADGRPGLTFADLARDTFEGGELDVRADVIEVRTPPVAWANAAAFLVPVGTAGRDRFVFVSARTTKGRAGFTLVDAGFTGAIGEEAALPAGTQAVLALAVPESHDQVQLVVRNASPDDDRTTVEILRISTGEIPAVKLEDSDVPAALRAPAALHRELVAARLARPRRR